MIIKTEEELHELAREILLAAGADERNALGVAEHLVAANLCGVDTHGVWHLPVYVKYIKAGEIVPTAWPEILKETPMSALITGHWTFGHVAARYAMEVAIDKATEHNVAVVAVVQVNHIGRLGHYIEMAAAKGMISMVWAGGLSEGSAARCSVWWACPGLARQSDSHGIPHRRGVADDVRLCDDGAVRGQSHQRRAQG